MQQILMGNCLFCNRVHMYTTYIFSYIGYSDSSQFNLHCKMYTVFINLCADKQFLIDARR